MAQYVIFSGESKEILVKSGTTEINIQIDLYSPWKEWAKSLDNTKYLQAFRSVGGDPTASGQYSPRYFFLMNGWRILVDGNLTSRVDFAVNLYVEEGGTPFVIQNGANVSNVTSDIGVIEVGGVVTDENIDDIVDGVQSASSADTQTLLDRTSEILGLVQSNFVMTNQVYNTNDDLLSATVRTYPTAADLTGNTNIIATYTVSATYVGNLLSDYRIIKV